jgi:hypothetical protein
MRGEAQGRDIGDGGGLQLGDDVEVLVVVLGSVTWKFEWGESWGMGFI